MYALILFGLGANLGDREAAIRGAAARLAEDAALHLRNFRIASLYESSALLPEGAPPEWNFPYLNTVCGGVTEATPEAALASAKAIEKALKRRDRGRWGPREIDVDVLALGDTVMATEMLTLPHPQLHKRDFVLLPLAEIFPDWRHPMLRRTARAMMAAAGQGNCRKLSPANARDKG